MVSLAFSLSLIFLILAPLGVSFSTLMMNFPSATERKNSEKPTGTYSCLYCKKLFANHRALGGHLKTHNVEFKSAWRRNPSGSSRNSIGFIGNTSNPLSNNQPGNSCGGVGNYLIPKRSCPVKTIPVHAAFAPLSVGLNRVYQLNNDEGRTYQDGKPLFYSGALQNSLHNLCKPSFTLSTITNPYPFSGSNQSPGLKGTAFASSSFTDPYPRSAQAESCLYKTDGFLTCEEGKRMYPVDGLGNSDVMKASKRPKTVSNLPAESEKSQHKELPLVKDLENPFCSLAISCDAEQEVPADIDLSLHL
ncbi:TFIIH C1-like domain containing protein [Melia azedarach]|uniref:TFIIH C1-like domain containing protein n=1 Tax=Melia azedarach TaxID=155640 RepID=A0ACC1WYP5_MELAZ|nr:TFIIH C1-like domain containing protein [Melia azedarach]